VITAVNGLEGVRLAVTERPDLVLLDVVMPEMDGIATCSAIRATVDGANVPILMVSTRGDAAAVASAYQCGCNEYILKPIDRTELLAKIRGYLERPLEEGVA
jgi:DNA-binding response OmpR family regulator